MYSNQFENLIEGAGILALLSFLWGVVQCFAGYKIFRFVIVLTGAIIGGSLGYLLTQEAGGVILGAITGGLLLWFFYQVGIFIIGMMLGYLVTILLMLIAGHSAFGDMALFGLILGIAGGIFALYYHKFVIIISTAYYGGFIMAIWLKVFTTGLMMHSSRSRFDITDQVGYLILFTLFFGTLGMFVQYDKLKGLFSGGLSLTDLKITKDDIEQERQVSPETMHKNLEDLKQITHKTSNAGNNERPFQPPNNIPDYHTRKVPTPGQNMLSLSLVQVSGSHNQKCYPVNWRPAPLGFEALVGKATANNFPDVDIPEPVVSRKHILLSQKNGEFFIKHLSATNPTYKNNQNLQPAVEYPLKKGDKLILGDIHFKVN